MGVYVIGGGGHGRVVISLLRNLAIPIEGIIDDNPHVLGNEVMGTRVVGDIDHLKTISQTIPSNLRAIVAVGNNSSRRRIVESLDCTSVTWLTLVHKYSWCHESVQIDEGSVVFAGAIIQPGVIVGKHCIINTSAHIDHDCHVKDYAHIAPGVGLAGHVHIDEGAFMGIGSKVIPKTHVGAWTVVGAGSTVTKHLPPKVVAIGTPAKVVRNHS